MPTHDDADQLHDQAIEAIGRGDYPQATTLLKQALTLYQDIPNTEEQQAGCLNNLATTPAARNSDIFLITTMPDFTPEPEETLTRTPGPNLVLPHPRTTPLYQHPTIADRPRAHYR